jgi:putative cardiolipin synthase
MNLLLLVLTGAAILGVGAVLAVLSYGHFAKRSRGEDMFALDHHPDVSVLDRALGERVAQEGGRNGLALVSDSLDAFAIRALTARSAGRSLDLMYYYWKDDLTGRLLARDVVDAADRGVRVRLLIDDINTRGRDKVYLALDGHPNISVRLFNPSRARRLGLRRGIEMLLRVVTINRRMHNKAWIADGRIAIVGGRNVGDQYFDADRDANFRDLDIALLGPAVRQAEEVFDRFWNSEMAMPIHVLVRRPEVRLERLRQTHATLDALADARPYLDRVASRLSATAMLAGGLALHWTDNAKVVSDPPDKAAGRGDDNWMMKTLMPVLASADRTVAVTSPYFVPGVEGMRGLTRMAEAGIDVAVLTNSLAATDVAAVHGGYAPYRKPLLASGVRLFELQPFLGKGRMSLFGSRAASLHSKAFTVDGETGFVGSFNFDPRSAALNTEMGVLFVAPELVADMQAIFAEETAPQMSWRLRLAQDGRLLWEGERDGRPVVLDREPQASMARRVIAAIVGWLPVESQL